MKSIALQPLMCFCFSYACLCLGCTDEVNEVYDSEEYPNPEAKIICPFCGEISNLIYKRNERYCNVCFFDICDFDHGEPFLTCEKCDYKLPQTVYKKCSCGIYCSPESHYCPLCGKELLEKIDLDDK